MKGTGPAAPFAQALGGNEGGGSFLGAGGSCRALPAACALVGRNARGMARCLFPAMMAAACLSGAVGKAALGAAAVEPPPTLTLEKAAAAADLIVDAAVLASTSHSATARVIEKFKGECREIIEIEGFNSYNWNTAYYALKPGERAIFFLSACDPSAGGEAAISRASMLTPSCMKMPFERGRVRAMLGDPPAGLPVEAGIFARFLKGLLERQAGGGSDPGLLEELTKAAGGGELETRYLAIEFLGNMREPSAAPALVPILRNEKLTRMRVMAAEALGKMGGKEAAEALAGAIKDPSFEVSRQAALSLCRMKYAAAAPGLVEWVRAAAEEAKRYRQAGDPRRTRIEEAADAVFSFVEREAAVEARGPLLLLARSSDPRLARRAVRALGYGGDLDAVPPLIDMLAKGEGELEGEIASALFRLTLFPESDKPQAAREWFEKMKGRTRRDILAERLAERAGRRGESLEGPEAFAATFLREAPGDLAAAACGKELVSSGQERHASPPAPSLAAKWLSPLAVPFLLDGLTSADAYDRRAAVAGLGKLADCGAAFRSALIPYVLPMLRDADAGVRREAVYAAVALRAREAIMALASMLGEDAPAYDKSSACKALFELTGRTMGFSVREPLKEQERAAARMLAWAEGAGRRFDPGRLAGFDGMCFCGSKGGGWTESERKELAAWIGSDDLILPQRALRRALDRPSEETADLLSAALGSAPSVHSRCLVAAGLAALAHPVGPEILRELSLDAAGSSAGAPSRPGASALDAPAAHLLAALKMWLAARIGEEEEALRRAAMAEDNPMGRLAVIWLGYRDGDPASRAILEKLARGPSLRSARAAVLAAAMRTGDGGAVLAEAVRSDDRGIRETAARLITAKGDRRGMAALLETLKSSDMFSWTPIVAEMDRLAAAEDLQMFVELMESSRDFLRAAGAFLLARHPPTGDVRSPELRGMRRAILMCLTDESVPVRYYACLACEKIGDANFAPAIAPLLDDESPDVRIAAAGALSVLGDPEGRAAVMKAARRLGNLDPRWLIPLARVGEAAEAELLVRLSRSGSFAEQYSAVEALGYMARPEAVARLAEIWRDPDSALTAMAEDGLARLGTAALGILASEAASPSPARRAAACRLAVRIGPPAVGVLRKMADDADPGVRTLARAGLELASEGGGASRRPAESPGGERR